MWYFPESPMIPIVEVLCVWFLQYYPLPKEVDHVVAFISFSEALLGEKKHKKY